MIFVSHREMESPVAAALVEVLLANIEVPDTSVRCTSVPGFQLPFGMTIAEQLKTDIGSASAVFALLTTSSLQSSWVPFELGAAWALGKTVVPILGRGVSAHTLPGPLSGYPVIWIDSPDAGPRLRDAILQVARKLCLSERTGGRSQAKLESFVDIFRRWKSPIPVTMDCARAFQISWLLVLLLVKQANHPNAAKAEIEGHATALTLMLPQTWSDSIRTDDDGTAFQGLGSRVNCNTD